MILQALYNYYTILCADPDVDIAEPGYSKVSVSYALNLSSDGKLIGIIPLFSLVQQGKKSVERPRRMNVPQQVKRSVNIEANVLCDNAAYVLGLTEKEAKDPNYARKRFESFRDRNIAILSKVNSEVARAITTFLQTYDPATAQDDPIIARHRDKLLEGGNLIFFVDGKNALDDPEIRQVWEKEYTSTQSTKKMQCLVTGEIEPIARLHLDIKGVRGAQAKGAALVSFNLDAFTSYRRDQGENAPVSQSVAAGYVEALNYLLSDQNPHRKIYLGDTTVVYWADTADRRYASAFYALLSPENQPANDEGSKTTRRRDKSAEQTMHAVAEKIEQGKPLDLQALREGLNDSTRFYVLGLAPNASRLAVRFFLTEPFGVFAKRIMQHYSDLKIVKEHANQPDYLSPYRILAECVSPKVTQREEELRSSWSLLGGAFMRSILMDTPYPEGLYVAIMNRIRHDNDEEGRSRKITYIRAAFIKAHLLRKYRHQHPNPYQEALTMALNESYTHPAYVLGRLFAWLEKAQTEAIGREVNATIKDRYFTSACAAPASVFPVLLRLSQHHLAKAEYGGHLDRKIQELLNLLDARPFPSRLTLDEQGIFVLGYYHQRAAFYTRSTDVEPTTTEMTQV
ncbi:type I-C CRISPR-associated protein Cas8c/Csd1 [Chloroflexus sp. MS-CIW-1]|uniref:type I-C CRISPR-associated protein Cas8c/Csd1 n=1 Tax=Chloroflexus sp. MS-CIW-1 TaxID=3055768 RepID=UPI002648DC2C|nr:type I-C CRISPR-associated protein Cas8c/Csd1 [Chloroflexus sp. MS-CIW-1]MDN5272117.1 type I-C CRISPR-associated protein Cas8c/Csd1 [Chloroflexus sp. MS-CIW-1]